MPLSILRRGFLLMTFLVTATLINGCTGEKISTPQDERRGALELIAHEPPNQGAPLKITLMQLSRQDPFLSAGYQDLQHDALAALPETLLGRDTVFMLPGDGMRIVSLRIAPEARYLGLFAEYKDTGHPRWRIALPLPPSNHSFWTGLWSSTPPELMMSVNVTPAGLEEGQYAL